jgi:hypothetical protein
LGGVARIKGLGGRERGKEWLHARSGGGGIIDYKRGEELFRVTRKTTFFSFFNFFENFFGLRS